MIRKNPRGDLPQIHESAYVDQTAIICGKVIIEENVFVGPYAVIRADEVNADGDLEPIQIRAHANIQDGVVIHSKSGALVDIGEHTSIAHRSIVHGPCVIGNNVFLGFNSVVFNCRIGDGWSPFAGRRFRSEVRATVVSGQLVYRAGAIDWCRRGEPLAFNRSVPT